MKYLIFTDQTCDLTREERIKYGIWPEVFSQNLTFYGDEITDLSDLDVEEFYENLENGAYPAGNLKTSSASPSEAYRILNDIVESTDTDTVIVYAGVSAEMSSGTHTTVRIALNDYAEDYPDRKFICIDSHCISGGQATFLEYLAKYDGDNIEAYATELGKHIIHLFTVRNPNYAIKSGRFSLDKAIIARMMTIAHLSVWMHFPSVGKLQSVPNKTTRADKILHRWIDYYREQVSDDNEFVRISYGGRAELKRAQKLVRLLKEEAGVSDDMIQFTRISPGVGAHTGSTVLAFFFKQKDER